MTCKDKVEDWFYAGHIIQSIALNEQTSPQPSTLRAHILKEREQNLLHPSIHHPTRTHPNQQAPLPSRPRSLGVREGATQHREPLRQSGLGHTPANKSTKPQSQIVTINGCGSTPGWQVKRPDSCPRQWAERQTRFHPQGLVACAHEVFPCPGRSVRQRSFFGAGR